MGLINLRGHPVQILIAGSQSLVNNNRLVATGIGSIVLNKPTVINAVCRFPVNYGRPVAVTIRRTNV
jgi:hypothetical protein